MDWLMDDELMKQWEEASRRRGTWEVGARRCWTRCVREPVRAVVGDQVAGRAGWQTVPAALGDA